METYVEKLRDRAPELFQIVDRPIVKCPMIVEREFMSLL